MRSSEHQCDTHRSPSPSGYSTGLIYTYSGRALAQCSSANVPLSTDKGASRAPRGREGMCMQYVYCHGRRLGPVLMKRHYFQCCFGSTGHSFSSPHDKHKSCVRLCTESCCNFSLLDYDVHQSYDHASWGHWLEPQTTCNFKMRHTEMGHIPEGQ